MNFKNKIIICIVILLSVSIIVKSNDDNKFRECQLCTLLSSHANMFLMDNNKYSTMDYLRDLCYHYDREILIFQNECIPFLKRAATQIIDKIVNGQTDYLMICIELDYCV